MAKHSEEYHLLNNADRTSNSLENEDNELDSIYQVQKTPSTYTFSRKGVYLFVITIFIPTGLLNLFLSLAIYKSSGVNEHSNNKTPYGMFK